MLPEVPRWRHQIIDTPAGYKTKTPIALYWQNPLEVVKDLYRNPIFSSCLEHNPYLLFPYSDPGNRVVGEFMSGEFAWDYQVSYPI